MKYPINSRVWGKEKINYEPDDLVFIEDYPEDKDNYDMDEFYYDPDEDYYDPDEEEPDVLTEDEYDYR